MKVVRLYYKQCVCSIVTKLSFYDQTDPAMLTYTNK